MKNKIELTVILYACNEGFNTEKTIKSIRESAKNSVAILLINDSSDDYFDYEIISKKHNVKYIKNVTKLGVAKSRDIGVDNSKTEYVLFGNSDLRFYNDNWWIEIVKNLKKEENTLFSFKYKSLDDNGKFILDKIDFIVKLQLVGDKFNQILEPIRSKIDVFPNQIIHDIPCVIGISYAVSKKTWRNLKGLSGLKSYDFNDNVYISLKAWLSGGSCKIIKNIVFGHVDRKKAAKRIDLLDAIYNKLFIAETIFPDAIRIEIEKRLKKSFPFQYFSAKQLLNSEKIEINRLKEYYASIFKINFYEFQKMNDNMGKEYSKKRNTALLEIDNYFESLFSNII